jgi:hypothetical protein
MDPNLLKGNLEKWRTLIEKNYIASEKLAEQAVSVSKESALLRLQRVFVLREQHAKRAAKRAVNQGFEASGELEKLVQEKAKLEKAIENSTPRLLAAVAVRLMRTKQVSV